MCLNNFVCCLLVIVNCPCVIVNSSHVTGVQSLCDCEQFTGYCVQSMCAWCSPCVIGVQSRLPAGLLSDVKVHLFFKTSAFVTVL